MLIEGPGSSTTPTLSSSSFDMPRLGGSCSSTVSISGGITPLIDSSPITPSLLSTGKSPRGGVTLHLLTPSTPLSPSSPSGSGSTLIPPTTLHTAVDRSEVRIR